MHVCSFDLSQSPAPSQQLIQPQSRVNPLARYGHSVVVYDKVRCLVCLSNYLISSKFGFKLQNINLAS